MGKRALVTGGTKNDVMAMAVLAMNIRDTNAKLFDKLIIYHDGISCDYQEVIKSYFPTEFIRYQCPISMLRIKLNPYTRYFTNMLFSKYECLSLLEQYEYVVWTDYDVIFLDEISEIFELDGMDAAFVVNGKEKLIDMFRNKYNKRLLSEFNGDISSITTPLFVVKNTLGNGLAMRNWCYKQTRRYLNKLYLPEQAIYSMLVQKEGIIYKELPDYIYARHPKEVKGGEKILHAYGQPKFWNGCKHEIWNKYHEVWLRDIEKKESDGV